MFIVERVGEPGWLNTPVTVAATETVSIQEQRLHPDNLHVVRVEDWRLEIKKGDRFEISLPKDTCPAVGDTLELTVIMRDKPIKSRWKKLSTF